MIEYLPQWVVHQRLLSLATACLLGLATLTAAADGHAQSGKSELTRGLEALNSGRNQEAVQAFTAAYRLERLPAALINLGIAYTRMGQVHQACDALSAYLRNADGSRDARNIAAVRAELERLHTGNAVITVRVTPPGAAVEVGGAVTVRGGSEVVVAPGKQRFVAYAQGYERYEKVLDVTPGRFTLDITLQADAGARPSAADVATTPHDTGHDEPAGDPPPCAMDDVCLGPVLALGAPNLVGGSLQLRFGHYAGAGLGLQLLPRMSVFGLGSVGGSLFTVEGRIYPFGGAFFLAAGFAYQTFKATVTSGTIIGEAVVHLPAFLAGLGFMGHDGFVIGVDLGVLFPLTSRSVSVASLYGAPQDVDPAVVEQVQADSRRNIEDFLDVFPVLLQLSAIRVGYLF